MMNMVCVGAAGNDFLMQRQSDLLGIDCIRPTTLETTGLGSALLAGLAVGVWSSPDDIAQRWSADTEFHPAGDAAELQETKRLWAEAISKA